MALALFAAEALLPGSFMLWLGFAAVGTALIDLVVPMAPAVQWMLFGVLSLVSVGAGWQYKKRHPGSDSDQPLLNRRGAQLIGQVFVLESAIVDGRGRLKIGDAFWTAIGPDLPTGARVRVVAMNGMDVRVEAAG
ncbi:MAG TPA: NfeD family protein [Xanthomonadaceae bacterium]|nr:NfeD family protein [Xanthomonadaceae bacterium]